MIQIDLSDHRPLYEQIKDKIKELKPAFEGNVKQACFRSFQRRAYPNSKRNIQRTGDDSR